MRTVFTPFLAAAAVAAALSGCSSPAAASPADVFVDKARAGDSAAAAAALPAGAVNAEYYADELSKLPDGCTFTDAVDTKDGGARALVVTGTCEEKTFTLSFDLDSDGKVTAVSAAGMN